MKPSASMKAGLVEQDKVMTNLAVGIPDVVAPQEIGALVREAADLSRYNYVPSKGTKKALANLKHILFAQEESVDAAANLLLVSGAKYGIYLSLKTMCNYGDTVILMQPYWLSYPEIVHSLGLKFVCWNPAVNDAGVLSFDVAELAALVKEHRAKALILNNPNNPAGKVFRKSEVSQINTVLQEYGAWLLIDEVYRDLVFDSSLAGEFALTADNIVRVGSLSKSLSIPGLRLGYICAPAQMISYADLYNQHIQTCLNSISCHVMENLDKQVFESFAAKCAEVYKERFELMSRKFSGTPLRLLRSESTFYSLVDFGQYFKTGQEACDFLAADMDIIAVAGVAYGQNFESYIRICLTLQSETLKSVFDHIHNRLINAPI